MSTKRRGVEVLVGLFVLIGSAVIAVMVVMFGRVGQGMQDFYPVTVEFPNASGLVKGSEVLLAGARIGHVADAPFLTQGYAVRVKLRIVSTVQFPRTSAFQVGSSGLLGDRYVDVIPPKEFSPNDMAKPGDEIKGRQAGGIDELTQKGGLVMDKLSVEIDAINTATTNINAKLLSEQNLANIEQTFANLRRASEDFTRITKNFDSVVSGAQDTLKSAEEVMKTADSAASDLRLAITDFRKTADSATKAVNSANGLIKKASEGEGTLGMLLSEKQTADNLRALIGNLRRSGVLFYKDRPLATPATASPGRR
jgi:ABC-type transporter Mla subunit MlaD